MKLIKPSFEILEQEFPVRKLDMSAEQHKNALLDAMYKHIELCGRTCYKSTDKITEDSAKPFVDRMIESSHLAMVEHATIYLHLTMASRDQYFKYCTNKYSKANSTGSAEHDTWEGFITSNMRVLIENGWMEDLQYICIPTEHHAKRHTVKFICNRQVSHEFVRHRGSLGFGFAQESTRYCNYSRERFGGELIFIYPCWMTNLQEEDWGPMFHALHQIEKDYFQLIADGWKPQQAATILPNALKTELIMTGFEEDWSHFFDLRALGTTGAPHPQAMELAKPLLKEFINRGYLKMP